MQCDAWSQVGYGQGGPSPGKTTPTLQATGFFHNRYTAGAAIHIPAAPDYQEAEQQLAPFACKSLA
eukprot:scaffold234081_cov17-Tisochrysis_lutea.AAC.1